MSLREWLIIIGALVILGVLIDGFRRTLRARRDAREFSQGMGSSDIANTPLDEEYNPELPGGSRVVRPGYDSDDYDGPVPERPQPLTPQTDDEPAPESFVADEQEPTFAEESPAPKVEEPVHRESFPEPSPESRPEPRQPVQEEPVAPEPEPPLEAGQDEEASEPLSAAKDEPERVRSGDASTVEEFTQGAKALWKKLRDTTRAQMEGGADVGEHEDPDGAKGYDAWSDAGPGLDSDRPLAGANRPEAQEVIVINVHCRQDARISGARLKRLLDGCGLEFGAMDIYHRHEEPDTRSPVQFSVANAVSPGTLRPEELPEMETPGISFFLSLPGPNNPLQAFDYMLETAQTVVRNLGGELKDEHRSVMTAQTIEHCRQRIREFERRQHFAR